MAAGGTELNPKSRVDTNITWEIKAQRPSWLGHVDQSVNE